MARLRGPMDVDQVAVRNTRRVIEIQASPENAANAAIGRATLTVLNAARDQQIENDVATAELTTRRELDELRARLDQDPDNSTLPERWDKGAAEIVERNSAALSSPRHQQLWRERSTATLETERRAVVALQQQRTVESARAGLIQAVGLAEQTLTDENATPAVRAQAMSVIETSVARARDRHTIGADDAERMLVATRARVAEFERTQGLLAQAQSEEDRIWAASAGDYSVAQEMARELTGTVRDTVEDRLATRFNRDEAGRREALDDAMEEAYAAIENGTSIDRLPQGQRDIIIRAGQMDTLRTYVNNRNAPGGIVSAQSEALADELIAGSVDEPRAFANADLQPYLANMNADDRARVRRRQQYLLGESTDTDGGQTLIERAYADIRVAGVIEANRNGVDVDSAGTGGDNIANRGAFNSFMMGAARRFVDENNRLPNSRETQEIARTAMLTWRVGTRTPFGTNRGQQRRLYQGGLIREGREAGTPEVRVNYSQIPQWEADRIVRLMQVENPNVVITEGMVVDAYSRMLAEGE